MYVHSGNQFANWMSLSVIVASQQADVAVAACAGAVFASMQRSLANVKRQFQLLAKDSGTLLVGGIALAYLVVVLAIHLLGVVGAWIMVMFTQVALLVVEMFNLVTLQEYSDSVIREPLDVQKTVHPLQSLGIIFRSMMIVQTIHVDSWFLPWFVYLPCLVYDLGFLRRHTQVDVTTLWKDVDWFKAEAKGKVGLNMVLFFLSLAWMLLGIIGSMTTSDRKVLIE